MSLAAPTPSPKFNGKLSRTMLFLIIPIVLVPIIIVGSIAYIEAKDLLEKQNYAQLSTIEQNAKSQINSWIAEKHIILYKVVRTEQFSSSIQKLFSLDTQSAEYNAAEEKITTELVETGLSHFVIVNQTGEILTASTSNWVGETINDEQFFSSLDTEAIRSKIVYRLDPFAASDVVILTAAPIFSEDASYLGAVIAITHGDELRPFLQTAQIYPSSQAYFINADKTYLVVTKLLQTIARLDPSESQKQIIGTGLTECLKEGEYSLETKYRSFDSEPVLGTFLCIPEISSGLIIEIPTVAVYARLNDLIPLTLGLLAILTVIMVLLIRFGASRIVGPIVQIANTANNIAQGDWRTRVPITRHDEIGLLAYSFNEMADQLSEFYRSLETQVQERTNQIYAISKIEHKMSSASTVSELFNTITQTIKQSFDFYHVSLYELNSSQQYAILRSIAGEQSPQMLIDHYTLNVRAHALIHAAITTTKPSITSSKDTNPHFEHDRLPHTQSAAIIPLLSQGEVFGILNLQSKSPPAFSQSTLAALQIIAEQFTISLQSIHLLESAEGDLAEISRLYQSSHKIAQTNNWDEVVGIISNTLAKTSLISGVFIAEDERLQVNSIVDPQNKRLAPPQEWLPITRQAIEEFLPHAKPFLILKDLEHPTKIPAPMLTISQELGCQELAFLPIWEKDHLSTLILLGSQDKNTLTSTSIQPYINLVEMANTTLENMIASHTINQQLTKLQTIQRINQTVSQETTLDKLFQVFHEEIKRTLGDVGFLISIYDQETKLIRVPYMYSKKTGLSTIPPFPLGEGLTSIIIRTKSPLMLVENTRERASSLGAKTIGEPARSWLGVPLLTHDEPIGTIVVQDIEHENAFTQEDLEFLSTLAAQVSIAIRNTLTLETIHYRSQRQNQLLAATGKIRSSTDMQTILATTAQEISNILNAKSARIEIAPLQETKSEQVEISA
ncbi:MAG: hypothetical protein B6243_03495 [Anaerolineaceae bacterium 4572_5.2]|nr:MAG: hypothetical protein B6243_03495 [Anaerolineaceae bacterium 4572_5.2]